MKIFTRLMMAGGLAVALATPAWAVSDKTANTVIGAGLGAAAGAVLSDGDTGVTLGAAAVGGLLGNVLTSESHRDRRVGRHGYRHDNGWHKHNHNKHKRRHHR